MDKFRISNNSDFFEMEITIEDDASVPSFEDAQANVFVTSKGFTGKVHCSFDRESLKTFHRSIIALEKSRSGEAKLESISPGELCLRLYSASSLGHLAISGSISHRFHSSHEDHFHSLSFGFEFDPSELVAILNSNWMRCYA